MTAALTVQAKEANTLFDGLPTNDNLVSTLDDDNCYFGVFEKKKEENEGVIIGGSDLD